MFAPIVDSVSRNARRFHHVCNVPQVSTSLDLYGGLMWLFCGDLFPLSFSVLVVFLTVSLMSLPGQQEARRIFVRDATRVYTLYTTCLLVIVSILAVLLSHDARSIVFALSIAQFLNRVLRLFDEPFFDVRRESWRAVIRDWMWCKLPAMLLCRLIGYSNALILASSLYGGLKLARIVFRATSRYAQRYRLSENFVEIFFCVLFATAGYSRYFVAWEFPFLPRLFNHVFLPPFESVEDLFGMLVVLS